MNRYLIIHKIKTLSQLDFFDINGTKINIEGYEIENWQYSVGLGTTGNSWIVKKEIESKNFIGALNKFRNDFKEISYKFSLISQCYFDFLGESFIILKQNNNIERKFILRFFNDISPVGLVFTKEVYNSFLKLNEIEELKGNQFFVYMNELNITIGYYAKLGILCSALESLAGKIEKEKCGVKYFTYDTKKMKSILGGNLYNKIFGKEGLRHKIQHGDNIEKFYGENYIDIVYKKILEYLNGTYNLGINLNIKNPQRHFYGNREYIQVFLKPKNYIIDIDLRCFNKENTIFNNDSNFILLNNLELQ